jgi:uncharacterized lipoprotein YehR (DUF1307 family)
MMMMMIMITMIIIIALISCIFPNQQNNLMANIKNSNIKETITYIKPTKTRKSRSIQFIYQINQSYSEKMLT